MTPNSDTSEQPRATHLTGTILMKVRQSVAVMAYGITGDAKPEIIEAGELVMPIGELPSAGTVDVMSGAGLFRINVSLLAPDR